MKYLLDTDHVSILQRESGPEFAAESARISRESRDELAFSVVSFHEQVLGAHTYINRAKKPDGVVRGYAMLARILRQFAVSPVLPFDADAATVFEGLGARRLRVATMDLRIAATALSRGLVLVTRNMSDFSGIPGLGTEDWTV